MDKIKKYIKQAASWVYWAYDDLSMSLAFLPVMAVVITAVAWIIVKNI